MLRYKKNSFFSKTFAILKKKLYLCSVFENYKKCNYFNNSEKDAIIPIAIKNN